MLIYVIIRARPTTLYSNLRFIERYRDPRKLSSEAGYYLTNLVRAVFVFCFVCCCLFAFVSFALVFIPKFSFSPMGFQSAAATFIEDIQNAKLSITPEEFAAGFSSQEGGGPAPSTTPSSPGSVEPTKPRADSAARPPPAPGLTPGPPSLFPEENDPPIPYFLNVEASGLRLADVPLLLADYKRLSKRLLSLMESKK